MFSVEIEYFDAQPPALGKWATVAHLTFRREGEEPEDEVVAIEHKPGRYVVAPPPDPRMDGYMAFYGEAGALAAAYASVGRTLGRYARALRDELTRDKSIADAHAAPRYLLPKEDPDAL